MGFYLTSSDDVKPSTPETPYPLLEKEVSGHRFNIPKLGRWLNRDPLGEVAGDNILLFVRNSPLDRVDSDGRFDVPSCCVQSELDELIKKEPYASEIDGYKNAKDKNGKPCLSTILCGKCNYAHAGGEYGEGVITICTAVSESILKHELEHAKQCGDSGRCGGLYPSISECKKRLCSEIAAFIRGDEGTGNDCDKKSRRYDKAACVRRAWNKSVVTACNGCRNYHQGTVGDSTPTFVVDCEGL